MTADEIREYKLNGEGQPLSDGAEAWMLQDIATMLREVAAQLAMLNENISWIQQRLIGNGTI